MAMTQQEFLTHHAGKCPNCDGDNITDDEFLWAGLHLVANQSCDDCGADWQVLAQITEYCNLETGEN